MADLIKRPEISYSTLMEGKDLKFAVEINIHIKYEGYIKMQVEQVSAFRKLERQIIPDDIKYENISGMRIEARQKLAKLRPMNIGQASRVSGVSPADINVLLVYLKQYKAN